MKNFMGKKKSKSEESIEKSPERKKPMSENKPVVPFAGLRHEHALHLAQIDGSWLDDQSTWSLIENFKGISITRESFKKVGTFVQLYSNNLINIKIHTRIDRVVLMTILMINLLEKFESQFADEWELLIEKSVESVLAKINEKTLELVEADIKKML